MEFNPDEPEQYVDKRETPHYLLELEEDVLFRMLGQRAFQIERDGYYNPRVVMEMDFLKRGKDNYQKYFNIVKSVICPHWKSMRKSGLFEDAEALYYAIIGTLLASDIPRALAVVVGAIIARRGLDKICREE